MHPLHLFEGKTIAIYGADAGGLAAVKQLRDAGANVVLWEERGKVREQLEKTDYRCTHPKEWPWHRINAIYTAHCALARMSDPRHPVNVKAEADDIPVSTILDLFVEVMDVLRKKGNRFVTITGSQGKSVLSTLIYHILKSCGRRAVLAGEGPQEAYRGTQNCQALMQVTDLSDHDILIEVPLAQLAETVLFTTDVAALTNIFPSQVGAKQMEKTMRAILRLHGGIRRDNGFIIGVDSLVTQELCTSLMQTDMDAHDKIIPVSGEAVLGHGIFVIEGHVHAVRDGRTSELGDITRARALRGVHMDETIAAAIAVCLKLGLQAPQIVKALHTFAGLSGRFQYCDRFDSISVIDDGYATSAESVVRSIASCDRAFWIGHGLCRPLAAFSEDEFLPERAFLYASDSDIETWLRDKGVIVHTFDSAAMAIAAAFLQARSCNRGGISILWAPGTRHRLNGRHRQQFQYYLQQIKQSGAA